MSLHHCLLTEIRNHTPQGRHGPPSIWNERCCSQQKHSEQYYLTTASVLHVKVCEELRNEWDGGARVWSWDWMMNAWCFDEPPLSVFSCFSDKFFCLCDDAFEGPFSLRRGRLDGAFFSWLLPCFPPPETPQDQITSARAWWNRGTKSSIKPTTFTWFPSIVSDVIKTAWSGAAGS